MFTPTLIRPSIVDNVRLFYRPKPKYNPVKFHSHGLNNITIMIRLYRAFSGMEDDCTIVEKDVLMNELFSDHPTISKCQVGRVLKAVVQYKLHFQKNALPSNGFKGGQYWRWTHRLEIIYGLENFMVQTWLCDWLRKNGEKATIENVEEELEVLRDMDESEELDLFEMMQDKGLVLMRA